MPPAVPLADRGTPPANAAGPSRSAAHPAVAAGSPRSKTFMPPVPTRQTDATMHTIILDFRPELGRHGSALTYTPVNR